MGYPIEKTLNAIIEYDAGSPKRIQHLLKVYLFARLIGQAEGLDPRTMLILEHTAAGHDIGIRKAEEVYGSSIGKYQEELGPAEADRLLTELGLPREVIDRACWLIAHHHTYSDIQELDHQILVEADFLVNLYEKGEPADVQRSVYRSIFKTDAGKRLFRLHFPQACE